MNKLIVFISLIFIPLTLTAQSGSSSGLVKQAVELNHDGSYNRAVKLLTKALKADKNNLAAKYELAYAYLHTGNSKGAVKYSKQVIRQGDSLKLEAYLLLGAAFDQMDKAKESLKIYDKAVHEFPGNNLALFNLGLSYYNNNNLDMAERSLIRSIDVDHTYASSHYLLSYVMLRKGETVKAMLSLYYFLLLEQDTERSEEAFDMLVELWKSGVNMTEGSKIVSIDRDADDFYKMLDLEIKLKTISYKNKFEPDERLKVFVENTAMFLDVISQKYKGRVGFWEHTYLDFFKELHGKNFTNSFVYYISNTKFRPQVLVWLSEHYNEFNSFIKWIEIKMHL
jgi:tetratricopeptide (TPR) repeat protein